MRVWAASECLHVRKMPAEADSPGRRFRQALEAPKGHSPHSRVCGVSSHARRPRGGRLSLGAVLTSSLGASGGGGGRVRGGARATSAVPLGNSDPSTLRLDHARASGGGGGNAGCMLDAKDASGRARLWHGEGGRWRASGGRDEGFRGRRRVPVPVWSFAFGARLRQAPHLLSRVSTLFATARPRPILIPWPQSPSVQH